MNMKALVLFLIVMITSPLSAQEMKIAVVGLVHAHVWGHLKTMIAGDAAELVGIAEPNPALVDEAKKLGAADSLFYSDYRQMLKTTKPNIVWAFVENNRHREIAEVCAPLGIHLIFEKPLASTLDDALEIRRLAQQHQIQVMSNYQMAWWPANYVARKFAESGDIGKVWRLRGIVGHGGPGSEGPRSRYFFAWLTDPDKNGGGALVDFQCYNALWSLWYLGKPETVYAQVNHLRPETFPKVEDNSTMVLSYKNGVGVFEGSWDLPRSFQDLEIFGPNGSLYMSRSGVELRQGSAGPARQLRLDPLPPERAEPIAYMVDVIRNKRQVDGLVALDINVDVVEIIEAAKESVKTGTAVALPLQK
jgi:predicted dehydrogenase